MTMMLAAVTSWEEKADGFKKKNTFDLRLTRWTSETSVSQLAKAVTFVIVNVTTWARI